MCMKGFVYRLSYDSHLDIDCDVSNAYCRFSSGGRIDLLAIIMIGVLQNLAHG